MAEEKKYERKYYHYYNYCSECPHRGDAHGMNCLECCPVKLEQVESGGDYPNKKELNDAFNKTMLRILS